MEDSYIASDGTQWSIADRNELFVLWVSDGQWAAVCEEHELPTDASVSVVSKTLARKIFDLSNE